MTCMSKDDERPTLRSYYLQGVGSFIYTTKTYLLSFNTRQQAKKTNQPFSQRIHFLKYGCGDPINLPASGVI